MAEGYKYFTTYRNHSVWLNYGEGVEYPYAATLEQGAAPSFTVFDKTFEAIRAQLDEIHSAGRRQ